MNIEDATIDELIAAIAQKAKPPYIHSYENFIPGKTQVLYSGPYFSDKEISAAIKAFTKGRWLTNGENSAKFERKFAEKFNVKNCLFTNSGSSANLLMISALKKKYEWKDGAEVIVSPVGFPTTIAPLVQCGLKPVFVDIEWDTLNFDIMQIKVTPNTRAIFVSPVLGNPPHIEALWHLAHNSAYPVLLIGDNCDSLGSKWNGKLLTDYYDAWTTSFYPAHHMSTGEGGMVCSNDKDLIDIVRSFAWWGRGCYCVGAANLLPCGTCGTRFSKWLDGYDGIVDHKYVFENMGYNLKPLDMQGAIGLVQLEKIDEIEQKRKAAFTRIKEMIGERFGVRVASQLPLADPCWFGIPIICETQKIKESLVAHFEVNKIQTRSYFAGNILLHPAYKHLGNYFDFPIANKALSHVFFLGVNPAWIEPVFEYIEDVLKNWDT